MRRLIIGLVDGEAGLISRERGAVDIEGDIIETFGPGTLVDGKAVGSVRREIDEPVVTDEAIMTERVEETERVMTEFLADVDGDPAWVAVDTSDGAFLWDYLGAKWTTRVARAEIDVDALAREVAAMPDVRVWQEAHDRRDGEEVGINYHADARLDTADGGHTMLGITGEWDGVFIDGVIAETGYVANWSGARDAALARWLGEAILPHAEIPEDDQQTLGGD